MDTFGKLVIITHVASMRGNHQTHKRVKLETIYCSRSEVDAKYAEWRGNNPAFADVAKLQDVSAYFEVPPEYIGFDY